MIMGLTLKQISGWVRINRLRANRFGCYVSLDTQAVIANFELFDNKCAYCKVNCASGLDFLFPIKYKAPCIAANTVPVCEKCKIKKNNRDILAYCKSGRIDKNSVRSLVAQMIARDGGIHLKAFIGSFLAQETSNG